MRHTRRRLLPVALVLCACAPTMCAAAATKEAEYHAVVELVESYFHVKHKGLPLAATAGMKAAKIVSADVRKVMRFGDFKLAMFEDQDFAARDGVVGFHRLLSQTLRPAWEQLVAVRLRDESLTYTYVKPDGDKFKVLIVVLAQRDGTVLQVNLDRDEFVKLLHDPEQESRNINDEAVGSANEDQ